MCQRDSSCAAAFRHSQFSSQPPPSQGESFVGTGWGDLWLSYRIISKPSCLWLAGKPFSGENPIRAERERPLVQPRRGRRRQTVSACAESASLFFRCVAVSAYQERRASALPTWSDVDAQCATGNSFRGSTHSAHSGSKSRNTKPTHWVLWAGLALWMVASKKPCGTSSSWCPSTHQRVGGSIFILTLDSVHGHRH